MSTATKTSPLDAIFKLLSDFIAMLVVWTMPKRKKVQKEVGRRIEVDRVRWPDILDAPEPIHVDPAIPTPSQIDTSVVALNPSVDLDATNEIPRPEQLKQVSLQYLSDEDILDFSARNEVPEVNVRTALRVECPSRRGFDPDTGLPIVLVEYHKFSEFTAGKYDASHPHISNPVWKAIPYPVDQATRWKHFREMWALDPIAAFKSTSYGLFQTMGFVFKECGCGSLFDYVRKITRSETDQFRLFENYLVSHKLMDALARGDWYAFAVYNVGKLSPSASAKRQQSYAASRKRYADMLAKANETEVEIARRKAASEAGFTPRTIPLHSARCGVTTGSACTCGAETASQGAVS